MKSFCRFILFIFVIIFFSGCNNMTISSDDYVESQDSQYWFINKEYGGMAETETGYYFLSGPASSFLYFFDKQSGNTVPVCNKPNCLHADEPDDTKIATCNAYLGQNICYLNIYKNKIYYVADKWKDGDVTQALYSMLLDGTKKQEVMEFRERLTNLQIHRGFAYYATTDNGTIADKESSTKTKAILYKVNIEKVHPKAIVIDEVDAIYAQIGCMICYGNNVFYNVMYFSDPSLNSKVVNVKRYKILTAEVTKFLSVPSAQFTIFNNKFIYMVTDKGTYMCDLNGENEKKLSERKGLYSCNNQYLFIDNRFDSLFGLGDHCITVIDNNFNTLANIPLKAALETTANSMGASSDYFFFQDNDRSNDMGNIMSLSALNIKDIASEGPLNSFQIRTLFDFIPKVPYNGVIYK